MGILNNTVGKGFEAVGLGSLNSKKVSKPSYIGGDFPGGFKIVEIINGREATFDQIVLAGTFAPKQPFNYGGSQQIVKEYYPGSTEPTVQVLGPREKNTKINGTLKTKFFNVMENVDMRKAAQEYQELIDAMRLRGNLVKITIGEWRRYGFIEAVDFNLKTLTEIDYEIDFSIVGFNPPTNYKFVGRSDDDLIAPNKEITEAAAAMAAKGKDFPAEMPQSVADLMTGAIDSVAGAVGNVTNFVTGIVDDAEQISKAANRAVGLISYARATISSTSRRIGMVSNSISGLGASFTSQSDKTKATIKNAKHIASVQRDFRSLSLLLASLRARFAALSATIPMYRHLVKDGDTLQSLSIKYFNSSDKWKKIYDHNKLTSTELVRGAILEIPRP